VIHNYFLTSALKLSVQSSGFNSGRFLCSTSAIIQQLMTSELEGCNHYFIYTVSSSVISIINIIYVTDTLSKAIIIFVEAIEMRIKHCSLLFCYILCY